MHAGKSLIDKPSIRIDIVSDIVCPWCVIGYLRLDHVLAAYRDQANFTIHWQPFELNSWMPPEGQSMAEHMLQKYGTTPDQSSKAREKLKQLGAELDFVFDLGPDARIVNTFDGHRLLHWAGVIGAPGQQSALQMALFTAHFSERLDVSRHDTLIRCAESAGMDAVEAEAVLREGRYGTEVRAIEEQWQDRYISGVPAFLFNEKFLITGAQDAGVFADLIERKILADAT